MTLRQATPPPVVAQEAKWSQVFPPRHSRPAEGRDCVRGCSADHRL